LNAGLGFGAGFFWYSESRNPAPHIAFLSPVHAMLHSSCATLCESCSSLPQKHSLLHSTPAYSKPFEAQWSIHTSGVIGSPTQRAVPRSARGFTGSVKHPKLSQLWFGLAGGEVGFGAEVVCFTLVVEVFLVVVAGFDEEVTGWTVVGAVVWTVVGAVVCTVVSTVVCTLVDALVCTVVAGAVVFGATGAGLAPPS